MTAHLPNVRKNRGRWAIVAVVVMLAFFLIWTMGLFGTPMRDEVVPAEVPSANP